MLVGIDEVGRGSWAGPLVAAAVFLPEPIEGLKDSKLLTKSRREDFSLLICEKAEIGLGWVEPSVIDEAGLTEAIRKAMLDALQQIKAPYQEVIIDGNLNFLADNPRAKAIIKADTLVPAVSAASIVAKVARDRFMAEASIRFPHYRFEKHVGYGTKLHSEMLRLHGVCSLHRLSYKPIKAILEAA